MVIVSFDVGKTGCRAALFEGSRRINEIEHTGACGAADAQGLAAALSAMDAAACRLGLEGQRVDAVGAGVAGLGQAWDNAETVAEHLAASFSTRRVAVTSDMTTSHAGALLGTPGVVVAAGTGAVALAVDEGGRSARADGWGYLLGDDGSGYAIGRAGLRSALSYYERRGGSALLYRLAEVRYGPLRMMPGHIHGASNPAREVAAFTADVAEAAREGDPEATDIWRNAAAALADTTAAATRLIADAAAPVSVTITGGLSRVGDLLAGPFASELLERLPNARLQPAVGDALDGGRVLATDHSGPHEALTFRLGDAREHGMTNLVDAKNPARGFAYGCLSLPDGPGCST